MTVEGFDYAWGYGPSLPAALVHSGAKFVIRYVGTSSKCIGPAELAGLRKAGIGVGLVYETTGTTFTGGAAAGRTDGAAAARAAKALGAPAGTPIWFAIDTDTSDFTSARNYLTGCASACAPYQARLYAGYSVIEAVGGTGHWQPYAWSGGKVSVRAGVYQYQNGVKVGVVDADRCRLLGDSLSITNGWLTLASTPTPPGPTPAQVPFPGAQHFGVGKADPAVTKLKALLVAAHAPHAMSADDVYGSGVVANVTYFQERQGFSGKDADGIVGPTTWAYLQTLAG